MFALGSFLLAGLICQSLGQYDYEDEYYIPYAPLEGASTANCAQECECPPSFPTAMYCNDRSLKFIPIVPTGIKYLYLQNNFIEEIKAGVFDNVTDLRWLVLDNNIITSEKIQAGTIDKLGSLEKLLFSHNKLTKPPGLRTKSLDELKLVANQLNSFPATTLSGMEHLTTLHLSKNKLTTESLTGAFKGLKSLLLLDVSENMLKKLPSGVPASLLMLYADNNDIDSVPGGYLAKLPLLQYLRVSHNKLVDSGIPAGVFNVSSLLELDLSFNKLKTIPEINESLEHLYLQVNEISKFDLTNICKFSSPVNYSRLRTLRLDGNNITHSSMPDDTANCLRQASEIIFE
ncbi:lumican [Pimephales promelas]|uniref:lumican n=1 Tax=Pimephales promelas TaxID=90988 RepID=UPI00195589BC|nr:lumican [Pimephales promelas]KAG1953418.1 lumican [Pimephales promelas]KAG1953419.1 lumican [Pimephales promelas]